MLPSDFDWMQATAIILILFSWLAYSPIISIFGHGTLNSQLNIVRHQWLRNMTHRSNKPFDAVLLGHLVHSVAFFGSATLIVLAGVISAFVKLEDIHQTFSDLHFIRPTSLELFELHYGFFTIVLIVSFFSFTYSLRKLLYAISLVGALPETSMDAPTPEALVTHATTVLSEATKTFNFGIRGYYYAVAALFLLVSPYASLVATLLATTILIYRQVATPTSRAIINYVKEIKSVK